MKVLVLAVALFMGAVGTASAQAARGFPQKLPLAAGDTAVNTTPISRVILNLSGGYSGLQIQVPFTSNSGTLAGTLTLLGSTDGVHYIQVDSTRTVNTTLTAPQFYITTPPLAHYKLSFTGTGTQSSTWTIWYRTPVYQTM